MQKISQRLFMIFTGAMFIYASAGAVDVTPSVKVQSHGAPSYTITPTHSGCLVNWYAGQLEAVGIGYITGKNERALQRAKKAALRVMHEEAQRVLPAIPVDADNTMTAVAKTADGKKALDDLLAALPVVDEWQDLKKGTYTVVGVLPLLSDPNLLTLVFAAIPHPPVQVPRNLITVTVPMPKGHTPQYADGPYTGIIFNNDRGLVAPCIFPRLIRFDGVESWGPSNLTPISAGNGPVRYAPNLEMALKNKLAGDNPLVLQAIGNAHGYPLINVDDALFIFDLQKDESILDKLPLIFTLGVK